MKHYLICHKNLWFNRNEYGEVCTNKQAYVQTQEHTLDILQKK